MNFYTINRGVHRRLHVYFSNQSRKKIYHDKIDKMVQNFKAKQLSKKQISEIKKYYASYGFNNVKTSWHQICTHMNGNFHKEYIPEDLFYNVIEPSLNMYQMQPALTDKNLLDRFFNGIKHPEIIAKNLNGAYYDGINEKLFDVYQVIERCRQHSKIIVKPSIESCGGKNVRVINLEKRDSRYYDKEFLELLESYGENFTIQSFVKQHKAMNLLNPTSLNTIRVISLLINNEVKILKTISRIGSINGEVDNISQGGVACSIENNGQLSERGHLYNGDSVLETETKVKLKGFKIPGYEKLTETIASLHSQIPHFKIISWDLALDNNGDFVLIEYNVRSQEILGVQFFNGPLFGEYTNEVLASINNNK